MAGTPATKSARRILLGVLVVACLVLAAIASAATTRGYHGSVGGGGTIHFRAVVANGQILEVRGFGWRRVQITCRQGKFPFRGGFGGDTFPVEAGGFDAHGDAGTTYRSHAKLVGHFRKHGRRAEGTLRIRGDLDAHHTNCDSGRKRWWAKRVS